MALSPTLAVIDRSPVQYRGNEVLSEYTETELSEEWHCTHSSHILPCDISVLGLQTHFMFRVKAQLRARARERFLLQQSSVTAKRAKQNMAPLCYFFFPCIKHASLATKAFLNKSLKPLQISAAVSGLLAYRAGLHY